MFWCKTLNFVWDFPPNMIIINHFGTIVTVLMFVYKFQPVRAVLCSTRTAGWVLYTVSVLSWTLSTVQLFRICNLLELYIPAIPLCGWLGSKHQLTNSKLSEWVLQSCFKLPRTKVLDQASGLEETKTTKKEDKKGLTMGFESSTAHVFCLHKVHCVWWAVSVHRCQLPGQRVVTGQLDQSLMTLLCISTHILCTVPMEHNCMILCVCVCVCSNIVFEIKIWATQNGAFFRRSIFPLKCRFSVLIKLATMARTVLWSV